MQGSPSDIYGPLGAQEEGPKGHNYVNSFSPAPGALQSSNIVCQNCFTSVKNKNTSWQCPSWPLGWGGGGGFNPNCTGGPRRHPLTNFAAHAKSPRFQPRCFMTFFFEVLRIFWHQVCENWTSRYGVTWSFTTKGQHEKWDFFHFVYKTNGKVKFLFWPVNQ